jgi:hypothetical protein
MANIARPAGGADAGPGAVLPVLVGVVLVVLFILGLVLGGAAEDDFTYFAGLAFAGFSLLVGWRYFDRHLP